MAEAIRNPVATPDSFCGSAAVRSRLAGVQAYSTFEGTDALPAIRLELLVNWKRPALTATVGLQTTLPK